MRKIGITTTIPQEIIYAAGALPVDLNNIFITSPKRLDFVEMAEEIGFGTNVCSWIKGIYGAVKNSEIKEIIAVVQGDCSNTQALMEIFQFNGIGVIPFAFPYSKDEDVLKLQIDKLMEYFGVGHSDVGKVKIRLDRIRRKLRFVDESTYLGNKVTGRENHEWLVNSSDFNSNPDSFENRLDDFIKSVENKRSFDYDTRLAFIGVPSIVDDIYDVLGGYKAGVVFNEVQRQFAMLDPSPDIVSQYLNYTYPYNIFGRIDDIKVQIKKREIDGIIHYVQSFCFRQIEDIILRQSLDVPILTIEADKPANMDSRTKVRLEAFLEMIGK